LSLLWAVSQELKSSLEHRSGLLPAGVDSELNLNGRL
jgi:hypothetical protein